MRTLHLANELGLCDTRFGSAKKFIHRLGHGQSESRYSTPEGWLICQTLTRESSFASNQNKQFYRILHNNR